MSTILSSEAAGIAGMIAATVAYATALQWMFKRVRERRRAEKKQFFTVLRNGLSSGDIETLEDVYNLYNGVCRVSDEAAPPSKLSSWLREFLVTLFEEEQSQNRKEWKTTITRFAEEHEKRSPYADLPDLERSLFADIERYIAGNDSDSVRRKVGELATSVQVRHEAFERVRGMNRWSVPLAVIGLILTVIFGLLPFFANGEQAKGEQAGAGQPATRSEAEPEGNKKPQPEAEERSR
jgi:hypothetical protein